MDAGVSEQKTVTLLIKSPNQAHEVQTVEGVCLNWTVKDLKTHLSTVYPTRPAVSDQRLIYAGKLLPDHLPLKDLFRPSDSVPTLHLVCTLRNPPQGQPNAKNEETEPPRPDAPELRQRRPDSAAPGQTRSPGSTSGRPPTRPAAAVPRTPSVTQPAFPTFSLYSPQQLLWLQHVYARQYYMQYHAALAAAGSVPSAPAPTPGHYPPVPAHQVPVPAPLANQNPINNLPANQNPAQDGAFINPGEANQNMRMNAQGGPLMEDEEDAERDWLDWLYTAARLGVLLMIVYFNSNLSRFLLVMSTLLLMYLHTAGWFPFRRRVQVQGPDHLQPPEVQLNQQNQNQNRNPNPADDLSDGPEEEEEEAAAAADQSDERGSMTAVLVPPHRVSLMWTAWVFFKTFFSSLIPEVPQVAN